MKKIMLVLAVPVLMIACKNNHPTETGSASVESITAAAIRLGNEQQDIARQMDERYAAQQQKVIYVNSSSNEAKVTKKKGMSKAAKGAIIGGTAGAVTGGIITKSGKGAVIGGVLGAGAGYIIGRKKDKRDGRVQ